MNTGLCLIIQIIDFVQESVRTPFFNEDKNENRYIMIPEDDAVKIYMVEFSDESEYVSRFAEYEKQAKE